MLMLIKQCTIVRVYVDKTVIDVCTYIFKLSGLLNSSNSLSVSDIFHVP